MKQKKLRFPGKILTLFTFIVICSCTTESLEIVEKTIVKSPYGLPLSAQINLKTDKPCKIKLELFEKNSKDIVDIVKTFDRYDTIHEVPVLGLYSNYENRLRISFLNKDSKVLFTDILTVETDTLERVPKWEVRIDSASQNSKKYFLQNTFRLEAFIYDRKGEVRGCYRGRLLRELSNGNYICAVGNRSIIKFNTLGKILKEYELPEDYSGIHHEIYELPNGNILIGVQKNPPGTPPDIGDIVLELESISGSIAHVWSIEDFIDASRILKRPRAGKSNTESWFHFNAVVYDPNDNSLIFSGRHQGIFKVGYDDKKLKWVFTPHTGFDNPDADSIDYLLTAVDEQGVPYGEVLQSKFKNTTEDGSTFRWPIQQHNPIIIPSDDGLLHLLVFNNDGATLGHKTKSLMIEYVIDEQKKTVFQYRVFDNHIYTKEKSGVDHNPEEEHYLMYNAMDIGRLTEFDATGNIIFQAKVKTKGYRVNYLDSLY